MRAALCGGLLLLALSSGSAVFAEDARLSARTYAQQQAQLVAQAQQEKELAQALADQQRQRLLRDRQALEAQLAETRSAVAQLNRHNAALKKQHEQRVEQHQQLAQEKQRHSQQLQELLGFIRVTARDVDALLQQSQLTALDRHRASLVQEMLAEQRFPGMDEVRALRQLLLEQCRLSGQVQVVTLPILDRQGAQVSAQTLVLGDFSAAYRTATECGFLLYSQASGRLFALSALPPWRLQNQINDYLDGRSERVPIDIGRGASLRQLTQRTSFTQRIGQGGVIVWPILLIGGAALLLVGERLWFLRRNRVDATALLDQLEPLMLAADWQQCEQLCPQGGAKPLPRVLAAGLRYRELGREALENSLQEAILGEIPRLERFLSTLAVLASIAPLLGLLGTVTGMINTFSMITFHGTGDPRLMSGGISEALVTTMLGLGVAIPIMLSHSLLSRRVETIIAQLEEKAIRFVNVVAKSALCAPDERS